MVGASRHIHARDRAVVESIFSPVLLRDTPLSAGRSSGMARFVGHAQELIPVPDDGEWVRLVPVIGTAT